MKARSNFHKLDNAQATQKVMIMPDANQTKLQKARLCNAFYMKAMSLDFAPYTSDIQLQEKGELKTIRGSTAGYAKAVVVAELATKLGKRDFAY